MSVLFLPKVWQEKNENGKDFQTSNEHIEAHEPLSNLWNVTKIAGRSH